MQLMSLPRLAVLAGPAGIGKTHFFLENFSRLIHESKNPFLRDVLYLLPTAEHRERIVDLMLRKEGSGFFGERVMTLDRLMEELLKPGEFSLVTDAQRAFLLSEIVREKGGDYFSGARELAGFLDTVNEFIGELKESLVSLEDFRAQAGKLQKARPEIREKYAALLEIYEAYEVKLEALGARDHRDGLFLLGGFSSARFRHLFVDGFFDFSKSQMEFLRWLAQRSERMTLALTVDFDEERKGLFEIPLKTLEELQRLGFRPVDLSGQANQRASSEDLQHVESNLFRGGGSFIRHCEPAEGGRSNPQSEIASASSGTLPRNDHPASLLILEATGIRGEAEMIAREIRRLVRTERFHFSDAAVILRRIGEYEGILRAVFREFEIPVEIHERERLRDAPLVRTLTSFFKILLEDWERETLFNFLKSSYVEKDYAEVCSLEIRGFALGITSGRERWLKEVGGPLIEKIRAFQDRFAGEHAIEDWIRFTEEVTQSFGLSRIPLVYEEKARRDFASLRRLQNLFEEIRRTSASWGRPRVTLETFAGELLGLIEVDLFSLHERDKNRVQVYDISLARQKEYKAVFLAGLLERQFPLEIREDPILSDEERRITGLTERLPRQAVERYFFYLGVTRARQKLTLSYPRFDLEGREALPSFYVDEVRRLFSEPLPTRSYPVGQSLPRLEDAVREREIEAHLIRRLFDRNSAANRPDRLFALALYNRFLERPSFQTLLPKLLFDPAARIESETVRAAFSPKGGIFKPTGLEIYGRCPYRYFAGEILHLGEEEEGIDPKEVGILLHEVLENYWRERVEKARKELEERPEARRFVKEKLGELLQDSPLTGEKAYRIELKKAQMEEWLCRMVEKEIEEGHPLAPLRPRHFEFKFGFKPQEVDYLRLFDPYREDILLRGKIDRIDVDPSGRYALVIDYKTGGTFKRRDLDSGTALQLPLYLLAVQQHLKLKPAGGEIYQINQAQSRGFYAREGLEGAGARTRSRTVFAQKEFDKILERAVRFSRKFAGGILSAEIPVRPRDCDDHCPYSSVCRIEKWRLPLIYQEIREEDKKDGIV